jgi:hypothetical protein
MNARIRLATIVALVAMSGGCNHRDSPFAEAWQPSAPPGARPGVASVTFQPYQALAGSPVWAAVALTFPAPAGGVEVSLSGDSAIESLPSRITVPAGSQRIVFQIATRESSGDRDATVRASAEFGATATGTLPLWATVADSYSVETNYAFRLRPPEAAVSAGCKTGVVRVRFSKLQGWSSVWYDAAFAAPQGMPLSVGTYEGAAGDWSRGASTPSLEVDYSPYSSCSTPTGRFIVRAIDCASDGTVRQFWVTYEQHCSAVPVGGPGTYGDIRVTNAPAWPYPYF